MKKIIISVLAFASVAAISSCKKNDSSPSTAKVMFVNGCAGSSGGVAFKVNNTTQSNASSLNYGSYSGYQNITAGTDSISVYLLSLNSKISGSSSINLAANSSYSIFAGGTVLAPTFTYSTDDVSSPSSGNAKVRLVNVSSDSAAVSASANTTSFATNIAQNGIGTFTEIPSGTYSIKAGNVGDLSTVIDSNNVQLNAGKVYTIMYSGNVSALYKVTVIANN